MGPGSSEGPASYPKCAPVPQIMSTLEHLRVHIVSQIRPKAQSRPVTSLGGRQTSCHLVWNQVSQLQCTGCRHTEKIWVQRAHPELVYPLFSEKKKAPSTLKPFLFLRQTAGTCSSPRRQQGPRCTGQTGQNGLDPAVGLIKAVLANFASLSCTQPPPNL